MCNNTIECLKKTDKPVDNQQGLYFMDTPMSTTNSTAGSNPGSNDDTPRVKLLCSFLGSIMPRPQDGKLRYVGGETRIVSLRRDISYEELLSKMRELYDGAMVLKYQQPDEDLDALVSVVNDDDVINMMEEYDKLGSGDGFTRLRIFLFSNTDQDGSAHYVDGDGRESERRYVDALNNLNEGPDFRRHHPDFPLIGPIDDIHLQEQFFNGMNLEGGLLSHRSGEMSISQYNLHHVAIAPRYNEMEGPWSPAYYSPRHHGHHDPRPLSELPSSPPSARYRMQFGELPDKGMDRMPEEYARLQLNQHPPFDHQPQYSENVVWMPAGVVGGDKGGFPGNLLHGPSVFEGNSVCEHCRGAFPRNQLHLEQPSMGNGLPQAPNPCADCPPNRETFMVNADAKVHHHPVYPREQNDPRAVYNETQGHERGWIVQHQLSPRADEAKKHISGAARFSDHYIVDGPGMHYPPGHSNLVDGHHMSSHHRPGPELGNDVFHDQSMGAVHSLQVSPPEEHAVRYGNFPYAYGSENLHTLPHGHSHPQTLWRNVQNPVHGTPFEASVATPHVNGAWADGSQRSGIGIDNQKPWVESSQKMLVFDGTNSLEYSYGHMLKLNPNSYNPELSTAIVAEASKVEGTIFLGVENQTNCAGKVENLDVRCTPCPDQGMIADMHGQTTFPEAVNYNFLRLAEESGNTVKTGERGPSAVPGDPNLSISCMSVLPDLIASVKKAALEEGEEVKARVKENADPANNDSISGEINDKEPEAVNTHEEAELSSDNDNIKNNKIEPTKAEAEAIERGLQTIKNDDLEEIRELGSGTYGAVYHGKWKGSDVAIKRIKASCFAGRPSERERLIADFWKEALILTTVTEFMVNGSLKQFLQKKDRTIDRRKRLIIAMDAAFGMEYLHGKNIVHFDLKCENLLVNMRDPQRPVCKIGDLGLSKVKQHTLVSGGVRGTLPWMAPELLSGKNHMVTEKIDVYSFGIVMWELLTGEEPYADMHCASIIGGIVNNTLRPQIPTWCDPEWKSLMESCWASDPSERQSFSEISRKLRNMAAAINVK
ncbi:KINASE SUPERFAMILY WITH OCTICOSAPEPTIDE/PHOX/BEM1P DOMAIN-CONTAINING PROTEIN [Salix purpurea]|uniref:KINASE SUPERFAMILY WITH OCTICOSAPEPTIDE/PHOX/BEM1P DOMAIN-CONTAINING PROTEIN n=1 Tax=Salix purpurea TaxID=77065 RepID=A0A9Q0Q2A6_SALPP|nr:KINASE SUPERFAMILY WITH OCTICOSAPEPTIDE/PHOX/BEM1P DOMAIN-CONTAINING PROTEIN [Salix purpurea]